MDWFSFLMFIGNADYMNSGGDYGDNSFMIVDDRNNKVKWHTRHVPKDLKEAYWSLGEAKMRILAKEKGKLTVKLETNTPNFDTFMIKLNNLEWRESKEEFLWDLNKGSNSLRVTTKNKLGVKGPENSITIIKSNLDL